LGAVVSYLESGEIGDAVIWSGDPLEVTEAAEMVLISGDPLEILSM
jgi:imidazolonepropionase-like amidohydrolase